MAGPGMVGPSDHWAHMQHWDSQCPPCPGSQPQQRPRTSSVWGGPPPCPHQGSLSSWGSNLSNGKGRCRVGTAKAGRASGNTGRPLDPYLRLNSNPGGRGCGFPEQLETRSWGGGSGWAEIHLGVSPGQATSLCRGAHTCPMLGSWRRGRGKGRRREPPTAP